ncbi:MAG TPA: DUF11 domain-containing protein [Bacteroidota bacterium]|nr:DUF11 domain-containing protein [Bacteroidota bacterium]
MRHVSYALFLVLLMMLTASQGFAAGTPAGTVISSRAKATYTTLSGATTDSSFSNIVSITVAQVAAVNVTPPTDAVTTSSDSVNVDYALSVLNSGNGTDKFTLGKSSTKGWTLNVYKDANGNGVLDAAELTAGAITATDSVKADSSFKIIVRVFVPRDPTLNNQSDVTTLTATSQFNSGKSASSALTTTVHTVNFSNISTGLTVDNASPSPGQNVTYTFTLTNNGSSSATSVSFSDALAGFTYVSSTTSQGTINSSGNPVVWTVGTIAPGNSATVTITLMIPLGASNGTVYNNSMGVTYTAGGETFTSSSNNRSVTVGVIYGVAISPTSAAKSIEPDDSIKYYFTLKNTGNKKDVLEMSFSSSKSLSWKFYKDVNNNGIYDINDTQMALIGGYASADSVQFSDSVHVLAIAIAPVVSTDQDNDVTTFTVTSVGDNSKTQGSIATTTFDIAVVSVTKVVAPIGNQAPGTQMTYTVNYSNTGHGKAYNFVISDSAPDSTTYVPGSITLNGTPVSDGVALTGGKTISVNVGTVAAGASGNVQFKITIN